MSALEERFWSKVDRADPRPQRKIAADFGVSQRQVSFIKLRKNWKHLPAAVVP